MLMFVNENKLNDPSYADKTSNVSLLSTYKKIWQLLWLAPVKKFIIVALTIRVSNLILA